MAQLPPELWMDIIETYVLQPGEHYIAPKKEIYNLSLTSYAFHVIAEPYIFRHFTIDMHNRPSIPKAWGVINYLHRRPEIHSWVRYLTVIGPGLAATKFANTEAFKDIWAETREILLSLEGLKGLRMMNVSLERETQDHLFRTLQLREFDGTEVWFHAYGTKPPPEDLPKPAIRSLILRTSRDVVKHSQLGVTALLNRRVERLQYSPAYASSFQAGPSDNQPWLLDCLKELQVVEPTGEVPSNNFARFLHRCPNLKILHILPSPTSQFLWKTAAIDSATIPNLGSYCGPWYYAGHIVKGRPVNDVRLLARNGSDAPVKLSMKLLSPLLSSTVPIKTLHLKVREWDDKGFKLVVHLFPKLEELSILYWSGPQEVSQVTTILDVSTLTGISCSLGRRLGSPTFSTSNTSANWRSPLTTGVPTCNLCLPHNEKTVARNFTFDWSSFLHKPLRRPSSQFRAARTKSTILQG